MSDNISRADAIDAVGKLLVDGQTARVDGKFVPLHFALMNTLSALPSAELPADAEFADMPDIPRYYYEKVVGNMAHEINMLKEQLELAEAEPKWNCTANFVAEQLDRLRKMTDKEKWDFFREFFDMGDAVQGDWLYRWNEVECSVCGEFAKDKSNFCPNCGARMKGGAE